MCKLRRRALIYCLTRRYEYVAIYSTDEIHKELNDMEDSGLLEETGNGRILSPKGIKEAEEEWALETITKLTHPGY
jgi:ribosomal protein S19E (S16A)